MARHEKPIDSSQGPRAYLAARLRALRNQSYRELAVRAGYSASVLSQAAAGTSLPTWPVVKAFVEACGGDVAEWERLWRDVAAADEAQDSAPSQHTDRGYGHAENLLELTYLRSTGQPPTEPAHKRITVFLLDDHEVVLRGIQYLLESEPDMEVVGTASSAAMAISMIPAIRPDVAILDVRLPDGDGVTVCREIRSATQPPPACLMLTSYSDDEALFGAIMAGAAGYMIKQVSGKDIVSAVRTLGAGGSLLDTGVTATVLSRLRHGRTEDPRYRTLSPQERKILDLIAEGLTNRQIAAQLYLAEKTVKNYVSTLLHKLGFDRRSSAAVYAARLRDDPPAK